METAGAGVRSTTGDDSRDGRVPMRARLRLSSRMMEMMVRRWSCRGMKHKKMMNDKRTN